ncbi:MAG TPA: winged helix-turn-helix transcriptional regulator, partial [Candidatus Thermoplasmatota archaeon]|nr:winged helix-turn-helix transcriptional regulator [Candidatus Thermoplasmatota archaeon]
GLRDFLAGHPGARAVAGDLQTMPAGAYDLHGWSFAVLAPDGASFGFRADAVVVAGVAIPTEARLDAASAALAAETRPASLPEQVPTAAALAQAYERFRVTPGAPGTYSFRLGCSDCDHPTWQASVGKVPAFRYEPQAMPPAVRQSYTLSDLGLRDGQATWLYEVGFDVRSGPGVEPLQPAAEPSRAPPLLALFPAWPGTPLAVAGSGILAVASAALAYLWPSLKSGAGGFFSRLLPERVAEHPARRSILQCVEAQPGIHFSEIARRTGLPNGVLVHHIQHLSRHGHLRSRRSGHYTLYFAGRPGAPSPVLGPAAAAAGATKAEGARAVLEAVRARPGLSGQEIARLTGLQPSTVSYHATRLARAGLLCAEREGRAVRFRPLEGEGARAA